MNTLITHSLLTILNSMKKFHATQNYLTISFNYLKIRTKASHKTQMKTRTKASAKASPKTRTTTNMGINTKIFYILWLILNINVVLKIILTYTKNTSTILLLNLLLNWNYPFNNILSIVGIVIFIRWLNISFMNH